MLLNRITRDGGLEPLADAAIMNFTLLSGDSKAPAAQIKEALAKKRMNILQASGDMPFVSCSMPITFIDVNDDCSDFDIALLPLSSRYAALFDRKQGAGELELLTTEMTVQFNATILGSNEIWMTAFSCKEEALRAAMDYVEKYKRVQC